MNRIKKLLFDLWFKIKGNSKNKIEKESEKVNPVLEKKIKNIFKEYFDNHPSLSINNLGVTAISFSKEDEKIFMNITLERPGILIGKQGNTIYKIIAIIKKAIKEDFSINIIESNIWN